MKIKVSEASGIQLDWLVTSIEAPDALRYGVADWREQRRAVVKNGEFLYRWSSSWAQGGPIIERSGINTTHCNGRWEAVATGYYGQGPTPLIAAMRCYCCSKLGDEVEVPDELV